MALKLLSCWTTQHNLFSLRNVWHSEGKRPVAENCSRSMISSFALSACTVDCRWKPEERVVAVLPRREQSRDTNCWPRLETILHGSPQNMMISQAGCFICWWSLGLWNKKSSLEDPVSNNHESGNNWREGGRPGLNSSDNKTKVYCGWAQ